ncbi:unnamed protein product, partial [marine sediment metagenome]
FENKISLTLESLIGYKVILFVLFMIAGGLVGNNPVNSGILSITGGAAGYFIPNLLLRSFRYRRQKEIDKDLPYVIDLLSVATLSGQNIYNAVKIVIEKYKGSICAELSNFIKDVDIGIGKFEAYRNLIDKSSSEDFKSFIFLLIQAERYGSSTRIQLFLRTTSSAILLQFRLSKNNKFCATASEAASEAFFVSSLAIKIRQRSKISKNKTVNITTTANVKKEIFPLFFAFKFSSNIPSSYYF